MCRKSIKRKTSLRGAEGDMAIPRTFPETFGDCHNQSADWFRNDKKERPVPFLFSIVGTDSIRPRTVRRPVPTYSNEHFRRGGVSPPTSRGGKPVPYDRYLRPSLRHYGCGRGTVVGAHHDAPVQNHRKIIVNCQLSVIRRRCGWEGTA